MKQKLILISFAVILSLAYWIIFSQQFAQKNLTNTNNKANTIIPFYASIAEFKISYPSYLNIQSDETITILSPKSKDGEIKINRMGTNSTDVQSYLADFDMKRTIRTDPCSSIQTKYRFNCRFETFDNLGITQKIYYFYANNSIFTLSATSPELYDELEQVVQSFEYTGE